MRKMNFGVYFPSLAKTYQLLCEIPDPFSGYLLAFIGEKEGTVLSFFLPGLHLPLETSISPLWHFCWAEQFLTDLNCSTEIQWGGVERSVQCEQIKNSSLEKKSPYACQNAEAWRNTDSEQEFLCHPIWCCSQKAKRENGDEVSTSEFSF